MASRMKHYRVWWRAPRAGEPAHCYLREGDGRYWALCGTSGTGHLGTTTRRLRPPAEKRCPRCDRAEVDLYQKSESLPADPA